MTKLLLVLALDQRTRGRARYRDRKLAALSCILIGFFVFNRAQEERDVLAIDFNKLVDQYNAANGIVPKPVKPAKTVKPAKPATNP